MASETTRSNFGHVEKLGRSRYRVYWSERGSRQSTTVIGTRDEADTYLAVKKIELVGYDPTVRYTAFYEAVIKREFPSLADNTVKEYEAVWTYLKPLIGNRRIASTSARDAERLIRGAGAPSRQRKVLRFWRKMCNRACHERIIQYNPIDKFIRIDAVKRRPKRLVEPYEINEWMRRIRGIKYEALLLCELGGGLSPEEACALRKELVTRHEYRGKTYALVVVRMALTSVSGKKVLKDPKNGFRTREMVIGEPFAERILELTAGSGPIVPSGKPATEEHPEAEYTNPVTITHNWKSWCERNGLFYVSQGNMRSSFATLHGEAMSPDSVVSGAMGHSDGTTKGRHYQRVTRRSLIEIADNLEQYLEEFR